MVQKSIICDDGQRCEIYCCAYNLVSNILCNETRDDEYFSITALNDLSSDIKQIGFENVDTLSLCTNSWIFGINCGNINYQECQSDTCTLDYTNKAICCSPFGGGRYSSIELTVNFNSTSISDDSKDLAMIGVYCDGYHSCEDDIDENKTMHDFAKIESCMLFIIILKGQV